MSLFENQEDMYEEDHRNPRGSGAGAVFRKLLLMILAAPGAIIWGIHFVLLFVYGRLRPSVVSCIIAVELLILLPWVWMQHPLTAIKEMFTLGGFDWHSLLNSYLLLCLIGGVIVAWVTILYKAYSFHTNPSLLVMDGWSYNFSYRTTPLEIIRRKLIKKSMQEGRHYGPDESPLGVLEEPPAIQVPEIDDNKKSLESTKADVVYRSYKEAMRHMIVTGATGSGKTVGMLSMMYNDIQNGYPIVVIDFKKSRDVLYFLSKWAKDFGREFYYFANGDNRDYGNPFYHQKATYDPFSSGEQSSRSDVILSLRQWDTASDVYKGRTESLLNALFFALLTVDHDEVPGIPWNEGGLNQIIAAMDVEVMLQMINSLRRKHSRGELDRTDQKRLRTLMGIYKSLTSKTPESKALHEQLDGIKLLCNKLIMSSYGNWLSKGNSSKHIDLLKASTDKNGPIILFGLSPLEEEEFAKSMGSIILSDLKRAASTKNEMGDETPFGVYIDEFQTIDPNDATDLLEKSRSAKYFCTLASQSLEKIAEASPQSGEATLKSVLDTCGNYLFYAGAQEDSAERMAKILGKTKHIRRKASTKANTHILSASFFNQKQGIVNKEVTDDWVYPPYKFQDLSTPTPENGYKSEAVLITNFSRDDKQTVFGAQRMQVIAQTEITEGLSEEFLKWAADTAIDRHKRQTGEDISGCLAEGADPVDLDFNDDFSELDEVSSEVSESTKSAKPAKLPKQTKSTPLTVSGKVVDEDSNGFSNLLDDLYEVEPTDSKRQLTEDSLKFESEIRKKAAPRPRKSEVKVINEPIKVEEKVQLTSMERAVLAEKTAKEQAKKTRAQKMAAAREKRSSAPTKPAQPTQEKSEDSNKFRLPDL